MERSGIERRLAVVLDAKVLGYNRLLEEAGAKFRAQLAALRKEIIEPKAVQYKGRIVKDIADHTLIEFNNAANAEQCRSDIQRLMARRRANHRNAARNQKIMFEFRIMVRNSIAEGGNNHGNVLKEEENMAHTRVKWKVKIDYNEGVATSVTFGLDNGPEQSNSGVPYTPQPTDNEIFRVIKRNPNCVVVGGRLYCF